MALRPMATVAGARGPAFDERVGVVVEVRQAGVLACRGAGANAIQAPLGLF